MDTADDSIVEKYVNGPSKSAKKNSKDISVVIGPVNIDNNSSIYDSPKINKHGLEIKNL